MSAKGPSVRELIPLLERWRVQLLAGADGLDRSISWAVVMRARLPAFEGFHGNEVALLSLTTLRALRSQVLELSLSNVVEQLAEIGVSAIIISGLVEGGSLASTEARDLADAQQRADARGLPLLALASQTHLAEIEREIIVLIVARRELPPEPMSAPGEYAAQLRASLRSEALDALLSGAYASDTAMRARATQLGYDLTQPHIALWIEMTEPAPPHPDQRPDTRSFPSTAIRQKSEQLADELGAALGAWASAHDSQVVALLPLMRAEHATSRADMIERASALLGRALGTASDTRALPWAAGVSEAASSPERMRHAAIEARDAARLGRNVLGQSHIARPTDLGVYRLLLALRESGDLAPFVERSLAPLLVDSRSGADYIETLEAFFACNGNLSEAARHLRLHRNSLLYRLNRARELLGHDLDDPELRLTLQLAIKGRRVLTL